MFWIRTCQLLIEIIKSERLNEAVNKYWACSYCLFCTCIYVRLVWFYIGNGTSKIITIVSFWTVLYGVPLGPAHSLSKRKNAKLDITMVKLDSTTVKRDSTMVKVDNTTVKRESTMVKVDNMMVKVRCIVAIHHRLVVLSPSYCRASPSHCHHRTVDLHHRTVDLHHRIFTIVLSTFTIVLDTDSVCLQWDYARTYIGSCWNIEILISVFHHACMYLNN